MKLFLYCSLWKLTVFLIGMALSNILFLLSFCPEYGLDNSPHIAPNHYSLSWTGSVLENGVSDFEPKSLTTHSIPNAQQSRNAAKSLSRATTGAQVSNLGMENAPLSSTNKRLGKSKALLGEEKTV